MNALKSVARTQRVKLLIPKRHFCASVKVSPWRSDTCNVSPRDLTPASYYNKRLWDFIRIIINYLSPQFHAWWAPVHGRSHGIFPLHESETKDESGNYSIISRSSVVTYYGSQKKETGRMSYSSQMLRILYPIMKNICATCHYIRKEERHDLD